MRKALSRNLYLSAIAVAILGTILLLVSLIGSTTVTNGYSKQVTSIGNPVLFGIAIFIFVVAGILGTIAYIGALIKLAMLNRWAWFVFMLLFSGITMLVYIIAGPETPASTMMQPPPMEPPQPPVYRE